MQEKLVTEIAELARHFYRLVDPSLATRAQAMVVTQISGEVMELLAATYQLDRSTRDALFTRLTTVSAEVLAERQPSVH